MGNITDSRKRANTDELQLRQVNALRQVGTYAATLADTTFKQQALDFWKACTEKIGFADTQNGYVSGALFLYDTGVDTQHLQDYEEVGGVGLVYLSWAGLALGAADDADKISNILKAAEEQPGKCEQIIIEKNGASLTINVFAQGFGLASVLGAGPAGGAVYGLVSVGLALSEDRVLDMFGEDDCDNWLNKFDDKAKIKDVDGKVLKLPKEVRQEFEEEEEEEMIYKKMTTLDESQAKKVREDVKTKEFSYFDPYTWGMFHKKNGGSLYATHGHNFSNASH